MDGIYVNNSKARFYPEDILAGQLQYVEIDATLSVEGGVAEAAATGARITSAESSIESITETVGSEEMGTDATTIKGAIAEHEAEIGSEEMGTEATTLKGAIAEHETVLASLSSLIGDTAMGTDATTVTGAIAEITTEIGSEEMGTEAVTLTGAIAEHETVLASLSSLIGGTAMGTDATTVTGAVAEHEIDIEALVSILPAMSTSVTNADEAVDPRKSYSIGAGGTNKPVDSAAFFIKAIGYNSSNCIQLAAPIGGTTFHLYGRTKNSSGWGSWTQII